MRENAFSAHVSSLLKERGAIVYPVIASSFAPDGFPDKLVTHPLWMGWLEMKGERTVVKAKQLYIMAELNRRRQGVAALCRRYDSLRAIVSWGDETRGRLVTYDQILETLAWGCTPSAKDCVVTRRGIIG